MKILLLLRHAKSSWKNSSLADYERPLNNRGRRAAAAIGSFLKTKKLRPDLVLSSTATRARETIEIALESAMLATELRYDERLYLPSVGRLIEIVSEIEDGKRVLLVGHNPGLEELLSLLTGVRKRLPTAALAKMVLEVEKWNEVSQGPGGQLEWLLTPKELGVR